VKLVIENILGAAASHIF